MLEQSMNEVKDVDDLAGGPSLIDGLDGGPSLIDVKCEGAGLHQVGDEGARRPMLAVRTTGTVNLIASSTQTAKVLGTRHPQNCEGAGHQTARVLGTKLVQGHRVEPTASTPKTPRSRRLSSALRRLTVVTKVQTH